MQIDTPRGLRQTLPTFTRVTVANKAKLGLLLDLRSVNNGQHQTLLLGKSKSDSRYPERLARPLMSCKSQMELFLFPFPNFLRALKSASVGYKCL